jgi:tetratricopeptide (TPR) repeat protein
MTIHSFLRGLAGLALSVSVFAQVRSPSTGPGTGGAPNFPSPTGPTRGTSPNFPGNFPEGTSPNQVPTPLYLTGKVVLDDGTPPPDPVAVQLVCRTLPRTIAFTDHKGGFSADVHDRQSMGQFADASENDSGFGNEQLGNRGFGNNSERSMGMAGDLLGCDLQASLPGFRSDVLHLGVRRSLDNPNVGTIFLHRLSNVDGLTISATSALAPKNASKALDKAREDEKKQKWQDAEKELNKAVTLYPKYAAAWYELGNVQLQQKDVAAARESYAKSLAADSKFVSPYLQLADLAGHEGKWQETADDTDRLLRLNPIDFPQAWLLNGIANFNLKKLDVAEKSAREGLNHDSLHHFPRLNLLLAVVLVQKQSYAESAENFKNYLQYAPHAADADQVRHQLDEVEKVLGPDAKKQ